MAIIFMLSACGSHNNDQPGHDGKEPSSLQELLLAHDEEVAQHGKDLRYIKPIGHYGRDGVLASLDHIQKSGKTVSSYNGMELVFGVAEEARMNRGYDICKDSATLSRLAAMGKSADAPPYERSVYTDLLGGYCKTDSATR